MEDDSGLQPRKRRRGGDAEMGSLVSVEKSKKEKMRRALLLGLRGERKRKRKSERE